MDLSSRPPDRSLAAASPAAPGRRAARPVGGGGQEPTGANGGGTGTSGGLLTHWRLALLAGAVAIAAVVTVNLLSRLHDDRGLVAAGRSWSIVTDELGAGATAMLVMPIAFALFALVPPGRGRWTRFVATQALGSLAFAAAHVAAFVAIRKLVYGLHGVDYRFGGAAEFLYEYRKDALAYAIGVTLSVLVDALLRRPSPAPAVGPAALAPAFAIQDGARVIRAPVGDILAATAAGNYVEFRLADGRRPLMRTTLAAVEAALAAHGLVRTHRSWLVNAARVREIAPTGSGDRRLTLDDGHEAPLSRRYEDALERLRG